MSLTPTNQTRNGERATYKCERCKDPFSARTADRKRGWARFCSKSCKAIKQTQRTGRGKPSGYDCDAGYESSEAGWAGHKGWF